MILDLNRFIKQEISIDIKRSGIFVNYIYISFLITLSRSDYTYVYTLCTRSYIFSRINRRSNLVFLHNGKTTKKFSAKLIRRLFSSFRVSFTSFITSFPLQKFVTHLAVADVKHVLHCTNTWCIGKYLYERCKVQCRKQ